MSWRAVAQERVESPHEPLLAHDVRTYQIPEARR